MIEVGDEIDGYCANCDGDTCQVVITFYDGQVRRAQCGVCGRVARFAKPHGRPFDHAAHERRWRELRARAADIPQPYLASRTYAELDAIDHPSLGIGVVAEVQPGYVSVVFRDTMSTLLHGVAAAAAGVAGPPRVTRRTAPYEPVPGLAGTALASLGLATVGGSVAVFESEPMAAGRAIELWTSAIERVRDTGLTPVVQSCAVPDVVGSADLEVIRARIEAIDVSALLAARARELSEELADDDDDEADDQHPGAQLQGVKAVADAELVPTEADRFYVETSDAEVVLALYACPGWAIPAVVGFGGYNEAPSPDELSALLRWWHQRHGAELVVVGDDWLEMRAPHPLLPAALRELAWEHYLACTDIVYQGTGDVASLARALASGRWYFWWD